MTTAAETREERFEHGMRVLTTIDGESGQRVIDSLADISPELGHQIVAWAFGDISRPSSSQDELVICFSPRPGTRFKIASRIL